MPETLKRFECLLLGHNEQIIQTKLDTLSLDDRLVGIVSVGVNVLAVVEHKQPKPRKQNDARRNH